MSTLSAVFAELSRAPDIGGAELRAWDVADAYLLDLAAASFSDAMAGEVAIVDDTHGALALGALALGTTSVRVHQDSMIARRALEANALRAGVSRRVSSHPLTAVVSSQTRLVLVRLPKSLDRLDAVARAIAASAAPDAVVLFGNRVKHMTPTQNPVLATSFARVDVSPARQKARVLVGREPLPVSAASVGRATVLLEGGRGSLDVVAHPGVFAGATLDIGTRALIDTFDTLPPYETAVDLACGTGVLAVLLGRRAPGARVIAADVSEVAVASTRDTAAANGVTVEAVQDDGLAFLPDASVDLVLLNPPFHSGSTVTTELAERLFADAARVLRPGGELRCVWNTPLGYRAALERLVGPTRQIARTPKFTVTGSVRG